MRYLTLLVLVVGCVTPYEPSARFALIVTMTSRDTTVNGELGCVASWAARPEQAIAPLDSFAFVVRFGLDPAAPILRGGFVATDTVTGPFTPAVNGNWARFDYDVVAWRDVATFSFSRVVTNAQAVMACGHSLELGHPVYW